MNKILSSLWSWCDKSWNTLNTLWTSVRCALCYHFSFRAGKTNGFPLENVLQLQRLGNKEMSTWFMCNMICSTVAGKTKGKLAGVSAVLYLRWQADIRSAVKEMCHLFQSSTKLSSLCLSLSTCFCFTYFVFQVVLRSFIVDFYVWCLFFLVAMFLIQNLKPGLCSLWKFYSLSTRRWVGKQMGL